MYCWYVLKKKIEQQTVTSMRAHLGTRVPEGIGLGKLGKVSQSGNSLPQRSTHAEGGIIFSQVDEYSDQLTADKPRENR
jgi:hypothetical protein